MAHFVIDLIEFILFKLGLIGIILIPDIFKNYLTTSARLTLAILGSVRPSIITVRVLLLGDVVCIV